jgi:hypothetical protein
MLLADIIDPSETAVLTHCHSSEAIDPFDVAVLILTLIPQTKCVRFREQY